MDDEEANNILATGAVWAAIMLDKTPGVEVKPELDNGLATNRLVAHFDFLKSPYRLTIERIPEENDE